MSKSVHLNVRVTPELLEATKKKAADLGIEHHEYVRGVLRKDTEERARSKIRRPSIPGVTD